MEPAYLAAITYDLRAHTPETKYFLIKLLQSHGLHEPVTAMVKELARDLGVCDHDVTVGIKLLASSGYIEVEQLKVQRDSPSRTIQCILPSSPEYKGTNKHGDTPPQIPPTHHKALIDHLLHPDPKQRSHTKEDNTAQPNNEDISRRHPITITNRLLLIVLLRYADSGGAVRQLGLKDLEYLTGISQTKMENQIGKLKREGYIRYSYPGITCKSLFGSSKGGYFLNLSHPRFTEAAKSGIAICHTSSDLESNEAESIGWLWKQFNEYAKLPALNDELETAKSIQIAARNKNNSRLNASQIPTNIFKYLAQNKHETRHYNASLLANSLREVWHNIPTTWRFTEIYPFFNQLGEPRAIDLRWHFQIKLTELATAILSDHWNALLSRQQISFQADSKLSYQVNQMLPKNLRSQVLHDDTTSIRATLLLKKFVWGTAIKMARRLQLIIQRVDMPYDQMIYTALPMAFEVKSKSQTRGITILCYFKNMHSSGGHLTVLTIKDDAAGKLNNLVTPRQEHELSEEDRIQYGLLCCRQEKFEFVWKKKPEKK